MRRLPLRQEGNFKYLHIFLKIFTLCKRIIIKCFSQKRSFSCVNGSCTTKYTSTERNPTQIFATMKKIFIALCASFALASCTTITKTATSIDVENGLTTNSMADLEISSQRVEHVYYTEARARRGGKKNLQNTAVKELLMKSGNADVLVAPEFTFVKRRGLFGSKFKSVEVSGYPAKYKNFRNK